MLDDQCVLRVLSFRPSGPETALDDQIRTIVLPEIMGSSGIVDVLVGRRADDAGQRVLATVWQAGSEISPFVDGSTDTIEETASVAVRVRAVSAEEPRILRVLRGEVREGQLEAYLAAARAGTLADADANPGLAALYLGTTGPHTFITVSGWSSWEAIEAATGGDIRQPVVTKNTEHLVRIEVGHYEILPNADRPIAAGGAVVYG